MIPICRHLEPIWTGFSAAAAADAMRLQRGRARGCVGLACASHKQHYPHDLWGVSRVFDQNKTRFNPVQYEKILIL
jgi:hypothetical protein